MRDSDAWYLGVIGVLTAAFFGLLAVPDADIAWSTKWPIDASIGVGGIVGSIVYFAFIRKFNPAEAAERAGQIAAYHNKVRELVWVPWIQETAGYPFVATANVTIRPVFQPLVGANERYFQSAQEHLSAYGFDEVRTALLREIVEHNRNVKLNETKGGRGILMRSSSVDYHIERTKLQRRQNEIWAEVLAFRDKIQEVVNDLEDGRLKGKCDYETEVER